MSDENEGRIASSFTQEAAGSSRVAPAMQVCAFICYPLTCPVSHDGLSRRALYAEEIPDQEEVTDKTARTFGVLRVPSPFLSSRLAAHGGQTKIAPAHRTRLNSGFAGAPRTSCSGCNPSIDTTTFMWACVAQPGARGLKPLVTTWTCIPRSSSSGVSSSSSRHRTSGSPPTIGRREGLSRSTLSGTPSISSCPLRSRRLRKFIPPPRCASS